MKNYLDRRPKYVKFVDAFFVIIILALPFERAFVTDVGQGVFLQYFVILFFLLSLPVLKFYYKSWPMPIMFYLAFLVIGTMSDWFTTGIPLSTLYSLSLRVWIVFFFMIVTYNIVIRSPFMVRRLVLSLVWFSVMVAVFLVANIGVEEFEEVGVEGARVAVLGANLNGTARDVSLCIFFSILSFLGSIKSSKCVRLIQLGVLAIGFMALLRTGSRGGLLAIACAIPLVVFTVRSVTKKAVYAVVVVLALVGMAFVVLNTPGVMDRLAKAYYDGDTGGREGIYHTTMYLWSKAKWFGYGCFAHRFLLGSAANFGPQLATHCTYTYALVAGGLFGAVFYYGFLISIVWMVIKNRFLQYGNFLLLCVVMALLGGITMNIEYTKWLYVVYGLTIGLYHIVNKGIGAYYEIGNSAQHGRDV